MSGPQGPDPTPSWPGQQPEPGKDQPTGEPSSTQAWQPPCVGIRPADHRVAVVASAGLLAAGVSAVPAAQPACSAVHAAAAVPADRAIRPAADRIRPADLSARSIRPADPVRPTGSVRSAHPVRPAADPVRPAGSLRPAAGSVPAVHRPGCGGGFQEIAGRRRRHHRPAGRADRGRGAGAGLLEARVFRHHQARRRMRLSPVSSRS